MCKNLVLSFIVAILLSACGRVNVPETLSLNSTETEEEMILRAFEEEAMKSGTIRTGIRLDLQALINLFCQFNPNHPSLCFCRLNPTNYQCAIPRGCPTGWSHSPGYDRFCDRGYVYCRGPRGERSCYRGY